MVEDDEKEENDECVEMCCPHDGPEHGKHMRKRFVFGFPEDLEGRGNVVMTRLNDEDLKQIDALVEVELFKSRSEAAAFFIKAGIDARKDLFRQVMPTVDKIREMKEQAKKSLGSSEKALT